MILSGNEIFFERKCTACNDDLVGFENLLPKVFAKILGNNPETGFELIGLPLFHGFHFGPHQEHGLEVVEVVGATVNEFFLQRLNVSQAFPQGDPE